MTGDIVDLPAASALAEARRNAAAQQKLAADPEVSAWVSANAGTGKTHVLVQRVLRLLLSGAPAESILCLTFTKAAAAEMANRLTRELSRWPAKSEDALRGELTAILQREPSAEETMLARCLFAHVLDAPGGLKIMTIHAFCDRVLRRFPLEAGVPPRFTILTDEDQRAALGEAINTVLREAASAPETPIGQALTTAIAYAGEDRFHELLTALMGRRAELAALRREQDEDDPFGGVEQAIRAALGLLGDAGPADILAEQAACGPDALMARAAAALREGKATDNDLADNLLAARGAADAPRVRALCKAFLTKDCEPRADGRFITKAIREAHPGLAEELCQARDAFAALECKRRAAEVAAASAALFHLGDAVLQHYDEAKIQRSALDFDGLIARTAELLNRSDAAAWVLFRLDADLRHVLIDEAQDTSPSQWALIQALTAEFFAGEGVEDRRRTLFAVGDEKQSIYGFQGAEPRQFAHAGRNYAERARAVGEAWCEAPLALSFRSTQAVLEAVDLVFADHEATPGLAAGGKAVRHFAHREGQAGLVEIWPVEKAEAADPVPAWRPTEEGAGAPPPAMVLANRIAKQIRHWLDSGEQLTSRNRPIRAGDILILVRKRAPFAAPMVKALKNHGIPVAGADRMRLADQIAVMDLMALGDFVLLPQDDLTLAALLRSPIFDFGDDDLFAIGYGRSRCLWDALQESAAEKSSYADAVRRLQSWQSLGLREKPFEFYMGRLENEGLRRALLGRLGPEAGDAMDEFLNLALTYETGQAPSLQGFLHWLRSSDPEIKRDMEQERDEVRVMTVHGSKGLEAGIVFLADTCSARSASRGGLVDLHPARPLPGVDSLPAWQLPGSQLVPAIREACDRTQRAERGEYQRLLYVAMTRARDRLYVAGFEGTRGRDKGCWYDLIREGLETKLGEASDSFGNPVLRMECQQTAPKPEIEAAIAKAAFPSPPAWLAHSAPRERWPRTLNPSRLEGIDHRSLGASPPTRTRGQALLRGRLVHRLLEILPAVPAHRRRPAGTRFLAAEAGAMPKRQREELLDAVFAIFEALDFGEVFGRGSQAEVALSAILPPRSAGQPPIVISGQVDRLICARKEILIVDYKSGSALPQSPETVQKTYIAQLAAYRLALANMFPGKPVRAALLWTEMPMLMEIPAALLDASESLLYESVRESHLDLPPPRT